MGSAIPTLYPELFRSRYLSAEVGRDLGLPNFNLFTVQGVEGVCRQLRLPTALHRSTAHECILLTHGSIVRSVGLETFQVGKGGVFFLPAGQITTIEAVSDDARGYYCHFDASVLIRKFIHLNLIYEFGFLRTVGRPVAGLGRKDVLNLEMLFRRLTEAYGQGGSEDLVQSYLLTILLEIKPYFEVDGKREVSPAVYLTDRFKELIAAHYKSHSLVSHYAELLNVSPNHLTKVVSGVTGKTPSQWIDELLVLEAKVLLYQSGLSVSEICYELGMDDPSYFGRMFKKYVGKTPTEFRRQFGKR